MSFIQFKCKNPAGQYTGSRCHFNNGEAKEIGPEFEQSLADRLVKDFPDSFSIVKPTGEDETIDVSGGDDIEDPKEKKPDKNKGKQPKVTK